MMIYDMVRKRSPQRACSVARYARLPLLVAVAVAVAVACAIVAGAQTPVVPKASRAPEFRLSDDRVAFPIVMVREFPFIEGQIAGVKGKLMLDTGIDQALALNDHRIPLVGGQSIGTGHFGSGQSFAIRLNAAVAEVRVGSLRLARATQVQSQDATQLERITPDFIGWIGYYFWEGYALKLDYRRSQALFYKGKPEEYLAGEKIIAVIPFDLGKLPNHPLVHIRIGGVPARAAFDTGQYGTIFTDEATKAGLLAAGTLKPGGNDGSFDLDGLEIGGKRLRGVDGMDVVTAPFPAAAAIGIDDRTIVTIVTIVTIGYGFLRQYKTLWDFPRRQIYLLAR